MTPEKEFNALQLRMIRAACKSKEGTVHSSVVLQLFDEIDELRAALEAAEKDAARYRWLKRERKTTNYEGELGIEFECGFDHWNDIDAAIDAAMKDEQK